MPIIAGSQVMMRQSTRGSAGMVNVGGERTEAVSR